MVVIDGDNRDPTRCGTVPAVPYPDIDEDRVRKLAGNVRSFANNVRDTHEAASGVITGMGSVYSGYSYDQLLAVWAGLSATHMRELDTACRMVAQVLDVAAEVVVAVKVAVLAELAGLAAGYAALTAGAFATGGLTAAMDLAVQTAARKLCEVMEQALAAYLLSEVAGKAITPLSHAVDRLVHGILDDAAARLLEPPPNGSEPSLSIDPDEVGRYAGMLHDYADDIRGHARNFTAQAAGGPDAATAHAPLTTNHPGTPAPATTTKPTGVAGNNVLPNPAATHPKHDGASPGNGPTTRTSGNNKSASTPPQSMQPTGPAFPPQHRSPVTTTSIAPPGELTPATPAADRPQPWASPVPNSDAMSTPTTVVSQPDTTQAPHAPQQHDTPARPGEHPAAPGQAPVTAGPGDVSRTPASVADSTDHPGRTGPRNRIGPPAPPLSGTPRQNEPDFPSPWARSRSAARKATSAKNTPAKAGRSRLLGDTPAKPARTPWSTPKPAPAGARVFAPRTPDRPTATPQPPGDATGSRPASRTATTETPTRGSTDRARGTAGRPHR